LWQWDLTQNPQSQIAKINLLSLYVDNGDRIHAHELADQVLAEEKDCTLCLINVAALAVVEGDLARATRALDAAATSMGQRTEPFVWKAFILARGRLLESEHDLAKAADDYHDAIKMDPLDPKSHMALAMFLARQGSATEARTALNEALPLLSPDMREVSRQFFEITLAAATKPAQVAPVDQP
jgi:Flp pilus assembly protein TadD